VQVASVLLPYLRRQDVCSKPYTTAGNPTSINNIPDKILMKILSFVGPEDVYFNIAKVCKKWNILAKYVILWKTLSYDSDGSSDISRIAEVRYTAWLGFRTN
jgi:hypothetical protein